MENMDVSFDFDLDLLVEHQPETASDSFDMRQLAQRIADADVLVKSMKLLEVENESLKQKLLDLNRSATEVQSMYIEERAKANKFSTKNMELTNQLKVVQEKITNFEGETIQKTLFYNQLAEESKRNVEDEKVHYEKLEKRYKDVCEKFMQQSKLLSDNGIIDMSTRKDISEIKRYLLKNNIEFTVFTSPKKRDSNSHSRMVSRGTQYICSTTTRSACTSSFIKKHNVGTNFPEVVPISIEDIFLETIVDLPSPIEAICNISTPSTSVGTQTKCFQNNKVMSTVGTCTSLCNVKKEIDFLDKLNGKSHPQFSDLWVLLGDTISALIGDNSGNASFHKDIITLKNAITKEEINKSTCSSPLSAYLDALDNRLNTENVSFSGETQTSQTATVYTANSFLECFKDNSNSNNLDLKKCTQVQQNSERDIDPKMLEKYFENTSHTDNQLLGITKQFETLQKKLILSSPIREALSQSQIDNERSNLNEVGNCFKCVDSTQEETLDMPGFGENIKEKPLPKRINNNKMDKLSGSKLNTKRGIVLIKKRKAIPRRKNVQTKNKSITRIKKQTSNKEIKKPGILSIVATKELGRISSSTLQYVCNGNSNYSSSKLDYQSKTSNKSFELDCESSPRSGIESLDYFKLIKPTEKGNLEFLKPETINTQSHIELSKVVFGSQYNNSEIKIEPCRSVLKKARGSNILDMEQPIAIKHKRHSLNHVKSIAENVILNPNGLNKTKRIINKFPENSLGSKMLYLGNIQKTDNLIECETKCPKLVHVENTRQQSESAFVTDKSSSFILSSNHDIKKQMKQCPIMNSKLTSPNCLDKEKVYQSLEKSKNFVSKKKINRTRKRLAKKLMEQATSLQSADNIVPNEETTKMNEFDDESILSEIQSFFMIPPLIEPIADLTYNQLEKFYSANKNEQSSDEEDFYGFTSDEIVSCNTDTFDLESPLSPPCTLEKSSILHCPIEIPLENLTDYDFSPKSPHCTFEPSEIAEPIVIPLNRIGYKPQTNSINKSTMSKSLLGRYISRYDIQKRKMLNHKLRPETIVEAKVIWILRKIIERYVMCIANKIECEKCARRLMKRTGGKTQLIMKAILEVIEDTNEDISNILTPPAPVMTESHQKILILIKNLNKLITGFERRLLFTLDERIFNFKSTAKLNDLINLTLLYIGLIDTQNLGKNSVMLFVYKCLYYFTRKCYPMIYYVLVAYPGLLPHNDCMEYDKTDPLISTIQCILNSQIYEMDSEFKHREIFHILRMYYGYERVKPSREEVIESLLSKIRCNKVRNVNYCFTLLCKRGGIDWSIKYVLNAKLIPMLREYSNHLIDTDIHDEKVACLLDCISAVLKPIPVTNDIRNYRQIFVSILLASERKVVQEASILSILRTSRFNYVDCFKQIYRWNPSYRISKFLRLMITSFVHRSTLKTLRNLENQI